MVYRRVNEELLWTVHARLCAGDSHRQIASALDLDKKTINRYAKSLADLNLPEGLTYVELLE